MDTPQRHLNSLHLELDDVLAELNDFRLDELSRPEEIQSDEILNRSRLSVVEKKRKLTTVQNLVKSMMEDLDQYKRTSLLRDVRNIFTLYITNQKTLQGYIDGLRIQDTRSSSVRFDGEPKLTDESIPQEARKEFQRIQDISYANLRGKPVKMLHTLYTGVSKMTEKQLGRNTRLAFLRYIQIIRHETYLEKMLGEEHLDSKCSSCGLTPLAGCYWLTKKIGGQKICYKCFIRCWTSAQPTSERDISAVDHVSYRGKKATVSDFLLWNEGK